VVIGDVLLDVDLVGDARRLCPDSPVPVLDDLREDARAGGAGMAATLALDVAADVALVAPIAADDAGHRLCAALDRRVRLLPLAFSGDTPVKKRVRAGGQSLLRLDTGGLDGRIGPLSSEGRRALETADAVLVSDYGRGVAGHPEIRRLLSRLHARTPVVWDPHPRGAPPVPGVHLVTPSQREAAAFAARDRSASRMGEYAEVADDAACLVRTWKARAVAVTLGERGALLSYGEGAPVVVPAASVPGDPCGAGDQFAAAAAARLGRGATIADAVGAAVESASAFVATGGVGGIDRPASPSYSHESPTDDAHALLARVRATGGTVVATGGCFDLLHAGHVATLRAARTIGDCLVVCLNSDASVRRLKGHGRPLVRAEDRARVLEALECVDAVVLFDEDTPERVLERLRPDVWAKGGDYAGAELPEARVLRRWGGQAIALPYVEGRSTTNLVRDAAATKTLEERS
jgi:rfaE bifunctional protein nucleotidyltransferase chain/domain/rfaE bifunctional protein kinase chain/domain